GVADDGADVEPVLQLAQHVGIAVHDRDLVRFFAGEAIGDRGTDLPGAENQYVHASHQLEIRVREHEPFRAAALEVHLHSRVRAGAFGVEDHAFAELAVPNALPEPDAARQRVPAGERRAVYRPRDGHRRTHLLEELRRNLPNEARRRRIALEAVQPALLGIGQIQASLRPRDADVAKPPL